MRGRNMGILRETLRLMKVSPTEFASLQFANGAYLAATRPNPAAAAAVSAPSGPVHITGVLDTPWGPAQVDGQIQQALTAQARTQRRHA